MAKRERPSIEDMDDGIKHSYDHRGDTGKYGDIYSVEVERWRKISEAEHEFCIIPYLCKENSIFRTNNPDFNKPFDEEKIRSGTSFAHKLTVLLHYNVGVNRDTVLCPRTYKEECPICEDRNALFDLIDKETDKDKAEMLQKKANSLGTTKRALYNVVVFDSDKEMRKGVQIWEAPHESIEDVLSELYTNKRTGEKRYYTIPEEGWNICFERTGKGKEATKYRKVSIEKRRKEDALSARDLDDLYGMAYNLDEIVERKDYQTLRTMLRGMEEVSEEEEKPDQGRFRGGQEKEEKPDQGRFRGSQRERLPTDEEAAEAEAGNVPLHAEAKGESKGIPKEYDECFGILNGQKVECEECPKKIWKECLILTEESKKAKKEPERKFRRGLE